MKSSMIDFNLAVAMRLAAIAILGATWLASASPAAQAQSPSSVADEVIEEVVVVGSRRRDRSAADSPVPVDVVSSAEIESQGTSNLEELIASVVPSFNVSQEPISDAATFIRPATLRGLAPDATLVLVNGKRRHRAAVIALLGAGVSGGSQAVDISSLPAIALDRLEVLRDGASSQYGSDAIAGVMNFVLKEDSSGSSFDIKWGSHYEGDGDAITLAGNVGLPISSYGFANLSFEWKASNPTDRAIQRTDAQGLIDAGNTNIRTPVAQVWGAPEYSDDYKLAGNFGFDIGNGLESYAFTNYAERQVEGGFYYRNPHTRGGVFAGPMVDPTTGLASTAMNAVPSVKVADLHHLAAGYDPDAPPAPCPNIPIVNNVPDATILGNVNADDDCYTLYQKFPGGFTPQFGGRIKDYALAGGLRGELGEWYMDISAVFGSSDAEFYIYNTINPQLLGQKDSIDTFFEAGGYTETDYTINLDISRAFDIGWYDSLNVAFGLETREEEFEITAGEPNSWYIDPSVKGDETNVERGLTGQGFGVGSNGFPGFQQGDAGAHTSSAVAAYLDLETNLSENFLMQAAIRFEDYEDFGSTTDGKLAMRYQASDTLAFRGAYSTGFRVPTAGQANLRNVTTEFNMGRLADVATLPPTNLVAQQKGAKALTPEESTNLTLGAVFENDVVNVTVDYYKIEIEDRIAFTSRFNLTQADIDSLLAAGVTDASSFTSVRFFSNQQTVEASGVDLVITHPFDFGSGSSNLTAVVNVSDIELSKFNPDFTTNNRKRQIEEGRPDMRYVLTWTHLQGPWRFMARARHYGKYYDAPTNDPDVAYEPSAKTLLDLELGYDITNEINLTLGLQNAFDTYPEKNTNPASGGNVAGLPYPESSPFGFNGGFYYLKAHWSMD